MSGAVKTAMDMVVRMLKSVRPLAFGRLRLVWVAADVNLYRQRPLAITSTTALGTILRFADI